MSLRHIIHLDMDAFFAQVEQRANPALEGKPVFVVGRPGQVRTVVTAASYEAKKFGVRSGMNLPEALALCPQGLQVGARVSAYVDISDAIFESLQEFSPQVEAASIDEFYLDVTHTAARWGGPEALALLIKKRVWAAHRLTCSVGVAPNRLLAKWVAGRAKPDGLSVLLPEDVPALLERLPVGHLAGIGPHLRSDLRELGLLTCGELGRHAVGELVARFGVLGYRLSAMGRGEDDTPVPFTAQEKAPKSVGHTQTLSHDVKTEEDLHTWILLQAERVAARLRRKHLAGHAVSLILRDTSFVNWSPQKRYREPSQDGQEIFRRAWSLFPAKLKGRAIRLVGVSVGELVPALQLPLTPEDQKRQKLTEVRDQINQKFGDNAIAPARLLNTEEPHPGPFGFKMK